MVPGFASSPAPWQGTAAGEGAELAAGAEGSVEIDASLLFLGHYERDRGDLVISHGHHHVRVKDYFGEHARPTLRSADGSTLPEATIAGLVAAGTVLRVAEGTGGEARPETKPIGRVESADGNATAMRNGVSVTLRAGDPVYKGDVVQTAEGGHLAVVFIDGTAFNLDGESRMVVDGMTYQQGATGNSALFSLVQGIITFVAGQTAKTGDMKVATPTATMGIRGTAVHVEIAADKGTVKFAVMTEPDGHTGHFDVSSNDDPNRVLFTVSDPGVSTTVTPNGQGQLSISSASKTAAEINQEAGALKLVLLTAASVQQRPLNQTPDAPGNHPVNPASAPAGGSSSPPGLILPEKGLVPAPAPGPEEPTNHSDADPTQTGSIVRTATGTGGGVNAGVGGGAAGGLPAIAALSVAVEPTGLAGALGQGSPTAPQGVPIPGASGSRPPDGGLKNVVPNDIAQNHVPTVAGPLHASAVASGSPITLDLLAGASDGDRADILAITDVTYAVGGGPAIRALPGGLSLAGSTLTLDPAHMSGFPGLGGLSVLTIHYTITDGHGGSVPQNLIVTLEAPNTAPFLAPDPFSHVLYEMGSAPNGAATLSTAVPLLFLDRDPGDTHHADAVLAGVTGFGGAVVSDDLRALLSHAAAVSLTESNAFGLGGVTVSFSAPNSAFEFLAAGESLQATYAVTVTDAAGATATRPVTITVIGTNDAPVFDGLKVTEATMVLSTPPTGFDRTAGSLHFTDVDLSDRPTATVTHAEVHIGGGAPMLTQAQSDAIAQGFTVAVSGTNTGTVDWTYNLDESAFAFLSAGQSVQIVSTVHLDDHHGGGADQDITLTVTAPSGQGAALGLMPDIDGVVQGRTVAQDAAHGVLSNDATAGLTVISATGASGIHQLLPNLLGPLPPVPPLGPIGSTLLGPLHTGIVGTYGTLTLASDGSYSYTADHGRPAGPDTVAQDIFTYTVRDAQGNNATSTLTFTITEPNQTYIKPTGPNDGTGYTLIGPSPGNGPNKQAVLDGGNGNDSLTAGDKDTVLIGGPGNDDMTSGNGHNTFVFGQHFGQDVVHGFDVDHDTLQFGQGVFASVNDVMSHLSNVTSGIMITASATDTVTLLGVSQQDLGRHLDAIHIV